MPHLKLLRFAGVLLLLVPRSIVCLAVPLARTGAAQTCCTPDQWESSLGYLFGGAVPYSSGYGSVSYDYTNQLLSQNQTFKAPDGKAFSQRILIVGKTKKMFVIDGVTGRCTSSDIPTGVPKQCVPSYFNRESPITLGDPSGGQAIGQVFKATVQGGTNITLVMTLEHCLPMSQTVLEISNIISIQSFFNLTNGIKDPSVFNIPAVCRSGFAEHDNSVARLLLRKIRGAERMRPCNTVLEPCLLPTIAEAAEL